MIAAKILIMEANNYLEVSKAFVSNNLIEENLLRSQGTNIQHPLKMKHQKQGFWVAEISLPIVVAALRTSSDSIRHP